jgi:hypothetical protein
MALIMNGSRTSRIFFILISVLQTTVSAQKITPSLKLEWFFAFFQLRQILIQSLQIFYHFHSGLLGAGKKSTAQYKV